MMPLFFSELIRDMLTVNSSFNGVFSNNCQDDFVSQSLISMVSMILSRQVQYQQNHFKQPFHCHISCSLIALRNSPPTPSHQNSVTTTTEKPLGHCILAWSYTQQQGNMNRWTRCSVLVCLSPMTVFSQYQLFLETMYVKDTGKTMSFVLLICTVVCSRLL